MPIAGSSGGLSSGGVGGGGAQGPQGATGSQGPQGHQGFQGNQGAQGSGGSQGVQGAQGSTGAQGPQGGSSVQDFRLQLDFIGSGGRTIPQGQPVAAVAFTVVSGFPIGPDLALNADTETIEILTDGIYSMCFQIGIDDDGSKPSAGYGAFLNQIAGTSLGDLGDSLGSFWFGFESVPAVYATPVAGGGGDFQVVLPAWRLAAGDTFQLGIASNAGGGTPTDWNLESGPGAIIIRLA